MKRTLHACFCLVLVAMTWVTFVASHDRNVLVAAAEIWADPWGKATLFDAYFAFLTVYVWIFYRETRWSARVGWLVGLLLLGNFAIAVYFLLALGRTEDWTDIFRRRGDASAATPGDAA
ncbi:MAG: DUF1475 family protein [Acidobacteriota bacterium]